MIASLGPLPGAAEYLEGVLCPVSKLLCYLFDFCFGDAHVAQSARKFEPLDEGGDAFGAVPGGGGPSSKRLCYLCDCGCGDAQVAQSARKFEPVDEGGDAFGWVSAEGVGELWPAISRYPVADYFEGGGQGYAGGVAVGGGGAAPASAPPG